MTKENVIVTITWNNPECTPQYYKINNGEWTLAEGEKTVLTVSEVNTMVYTKLVYDGTEDSEIKRTKVENIDRLAPTGLFTINETKPRYDGLVTLNIETSDDAKEEGDINLTKEDFEKIPAYIETYDELVYAIRYASGNTKVCISKKTEDGRIVLIHAVSKSRGSLNLKNMIGMSEEKYVSEYQEKYKKKGSPNSRGSKSSNTSLRDGTASSDIISDTDPVVNTFEQKTVEKNKRSRNVSDEKVTLSKGKLAALRACDQIFIQCRAQITHMHKTGGAGGIT